MINQLINQSNENIDNIFLKRLVRFKRAKTQKRQPNFSIKNWSIEHTNKKDKIIKNYY